MTLLASNDDITLVQKLRPEPTKKEGRHYVRPSGPRRKLSDREKEHSQVTDAEWERRFNLLFAQSMRDYYSGAVCSSKSSTWWSDFS